MRPRFKYNEQKKFFFSFKLFIALFNFYEKQ